MCRHQKFVENVRFSLEVDGMPTPIPEEAFKRHYSRKLFSLHEAFLANDVVGITCLVPGEINNDDFWRLMSLAGEYYGMSPFEPGKYGMFKIESIRRRGPEPESSDEPSIQNQSDGRGEVIATSV